MQTAGAVAATENRKETSSKNEGATLPISLPAALQLCCTSPCDVMETLLSADNACTLRHATEEELWCMIGDNARVSGLKPCSKTNCTARTQERRESAAAPDASSVLSSNRGNSRSFFPSCRVESVCLESVWVARLPGEKMLGGREYRRRQALRMTVNRCWGNS